MTGFRTFRPTTRAFAAKPLHARGLLRACIVWGIGLGASIAVAQTANSGPAKPPAATSQPRPAGASAQPRPSGVAPRPVNAQPPRPVNAQPPRPPNTPPPRPPNAQAPRPASPPPLRPATPAAAPQANQALARLLAQATTALAAQDHPGAYRALVQAYPLAPGVVLHHFALVALAEQHTVEARDLWRRFLADPAVEATSPLRTEAQQKLEQLPVLDAGEVIIGAPRGSQVQLDGKLVGTVPLTMPLLVQTGRHRVAVSQGRWTAETELQVRTARQSEVRFKAGSDVAVVTLPSAVLYCDTPELDAATREALTLALETAVKRENFALLPRESAYAYAHDLPSCQSGGASCCEDLARRYGVDYLLDVRLKREGEDWQLEAQLRDMQIEDTAGSANPTCAGCATDKLASKLGETAGQLLSTAAGRPRGSIEVTSTPVGAEIFVAGRRVGVTPYQHAMWAGSYQIELRHPSFRPQTQSVEVGSEKPAQLAVTLDPDSGVAIVPRDGDLRPQPKKRPTWRIAVGAASIGAGLLMVGFGAAGLAANGTCAVDGAPDGMCPRAYNTLGIGAGLVGAGGALAIGGAVLIALPPRK